MIAFLLLLVLRILATGWLITAAAWLVVEANHPMPAWKRIWRAVTWWPYYLRYPDVRSPMLLLAYAWFKLRHYAAFRRR
ncbi:hypothetical protein LK533_06145 [Sphingomonas sp. PL-96]|uniref:hypothetical protein n=1 Tax=Sphingomonas sp. PL-96 TaxID=2887201 RepID=UPI001E4F41CA|nr:hypothetical protein [Sphingomonas sp. PL-96]MCC2976254.1 hypothetical protein [Sphingomonas sp. PL-96]